MELKTAGVKNQQDEESGNICTECGAELEDGVCAECGGTEKTDEEESSDETAGDENEDWIK